MPRIADHHARRLQFAQAVWAVIAEHGIEGVTFRRVAAEAGASVGRLQHYYDSREQLIQDSCRQMIALAARLHLGGDVEPSEDETAGRAEADPREQLYALLRHGIPEGLATRRGIAVWSAYQAKSVDDSVIAALIAEAERSAVAHAAHLIAAVQHRMPPSEVPAEDLALELLALAQGLASRVLTGSLDADTALAVLDRRLTREGLSASCSS